MISLKWLMFITYAAVSFYVFLIVYETTTLVIDEVFHLRQGMHYCNGDFDIVRILKYNINLKYLKYINLFISVGSKNYYIPWTLYSIHYYVLSIWSL